jgi:hypothetical protein
MRNEDEGKRLKVGHKGAWGEREVDNAIEERPERREGWQ